MTGWQTKSAAHFPSPSTTRRIVVAIATVTIFVAFSSVAQTSSSSSPAASKLSQMPVAPPAPLPVDTAFPMLASFDKKGKVTLKIDVLPGHYLYRDRFEFARDGEASYAIDQFKQSKEAVGKAMNDAHFGVVKVFAAPLTLWVGQSAQPKTVLMVTYQGCSEIAGICYPPVRRTFELASGASDVVAKEAPKSGLGSLVKKNVSQ